MGPLRISGNAGRPGDSRGRRRLDHGALLLVFFLVLTAGGGGTGLATAAPPAADTAVSTDGLLNFDALVNVALRQSPYLVKSSLEIEIRRLDESDSRYGMVPPLTFRSYYYLNRPRDAGDLSTQNYSLTFSMEPYNPVGSYLSLQAHKLATQIAILAHLKVISEGLRNLGKLFMDLGTLKRLAAYQTELVNLARENLTFAENRQSIGTGTSLEVKVAAQELELARNEQKRIQQTEKRTLGQLRSFLGIKTEKNLNLDLRDARRQVLGSFDPAAATLEQAKEHSYEIKIYELKQKLQGYNVALAKAKMFPNILFTAKNPDPLSLNSSHGLFVGFGLEVPVWDGFKRLRNVSRQKIIERQYGAEKDEKELGLGDQWQAVQGQLQEAAAAWNLARSHEELARLKERQADIRYQSGSIQLPGYLEGRKGILDTQKAAALRAKVYDEAVLQLRLISGDLGQHYVDQSAWQKN